MPTGAFLPLDTVEIIFELLTAHRVLQNRRLRAVSSSRASIKVLEYVSPLVIVPSFSMMRL